MIADKTKILRLPANNAGRDFIVGDTHGCYLELMTLLNHVEFNLTKDRLFSVGDLIDRGPFNIEMLDLLYEPWFIPVCGNHDDMMRMYFTTGYGSTVGAVWFNNGGDWILDDAIDQTVLSTYARKMVDLPDVIHVDGVGPAKFNIVHSELVGNKPLSDDNLETSEISRERALWGRTYCGSHRPYRVDNIQSEDLSIVYCGHTAHHEIQTFLRQINIDTGCTYEYTGGDRNRKPSKTTKLTLMHPASGIAYSCKGRTLEIAEICLRDTINKLSNTDNFFVEALVTTKEI